MERHFSPAIIMQIIEFGESDLLVTSFTSDKGQLKGIAKAARKSRKRFANCLDLFCLVNLEYEPRRHGDLYFLHSCTLINAFPQIRSDFYSLALASYMIELTRILFPPGVVNKEIFELLKSLLSKINKGRQNDLLRICFEARAMALGGYKINLERCCNCGRPYTGKGKGIFIRSKGGIACLNCERETTLSPALEPNAIRLLEVVQTSPLITSEGLSLIEGLTSEIKPVLKYHIEYRIGQRLKSAEYLE